MTKLYPILNIVLLAAVAVLYYLHFSSGTPKKTAVQIPAASSTQSSGSAAHASFPSTAYVDFDSINNNVNFIKQSKTNLEEEQRQIMNEYNDACRKQEIEKADFIKRGNTITQQQAEEFQNKWLGRQQEIENKKQSKGQELAKKGSEVMEKIQSTVKDFLKEYNKDKNYTYIFATGAGYDYLFYKDSSQNITPDIIKGLNEKMAAKQKQ